MQIKNKIFGFMLALVFGSITATAGTRIQQLALEAHDGNRITGFIYQNRETEKDAPLAILMHGMTGSSLFWLAEDNMIQGAKLSRILIEKGYRIVALEARAHGARKEGASPYERVQGVRNGEPAEYIHMIENTVRDYQTLYAYLVERYAPPRKVVAVGYSMGAQTAILFAAQEPAVTELVTMVPPAVRHVPQVSPFSFSNKIVDPWLLLTANSDQFSTKEQNQDLANSAQGPVNHVTFESGHLLPDTYLDSIATWLSRDQGAK